jgi:hypothetical protein
LFFDGDPNGGHLSKFGSTQLSQRLAAAFEAPALSLKADIAE